MLTMTHQAGTREYLSSALYDRGSEIPEKIMTISLKHGISQETGCFQKKSEVKRDGLNIGESKDGVKVAKTKKTQWAHRERLVYKKGVFGCQRRV